VGQPERAATIFRFRFTEARATRPAASETEDPLLEHLALGEIMAGAYRDKDETTAQAIRDGMVRANIRLLPFDQQSVEPFAHSGGT
jgi:hypothetical protein